MNSSQFRVEVAAHHLLMVAAHAMTGDCEQFMAAKTDGYVSKTMSEASLRKEIHRVIGA